MTGRCRRPSPPRRSRSPRSTARTSSTSGFRASGGRSRSGCSTRWGRSAPCAPATPRSATGDESHPARRHPAQAARAASGTTGRVEPASPYPTGDSLPAAAAGLAAMIAAGLPLHCVALDGDGLVRHARRPGARARSGTEDDGGFAARVPARPRGARRRRPRADARLDGVRPPREGERLGRYRPRRRGFGVPDRHARVAASRSANSSGSRTGSTRRQPEATTDFRGVYARAARAMAVFRRVANHPGRDELPAADALVEMKLFAASLLATTSLAAGHQPSRAHEMQMVAQEYSFTLSRLKVHAGPGADRARQLRPGSARPARPASRRGHSPGSA